MTRYNNKKTDGRLTIGQKVQVTAAFLKVSPKSVMRRGVLINFCRDTECRVAFEETVLPRQIDVRFLEPAK